MKFLADQDVWAATTRFLRSQGHDVVTVSELELSRAEDEHLPTIALREGRLMITRDRDVGGLVFALGTAFENPKCTSRRKERP